jgi:hypothetical protein
MSLLSRLRRRPRPYLAPAMQAVLRRGTDRLIADLKNAAPGCDPEAAEAEPTRKDPAMTIVTRKAFEVRAGDVIVTDPDHPDRDVRWRAKAPAKRTASDRTLIDCTDLADGRDVLAVFASLDEVSVEPAGVR